MFFGEDSLKGLKKELKVANADMNFAKHVFRFMAQSFNSVPEQHKREKAVNVG